MLETYHREAESTAPVAELDSAHTDGFEDVGLGTPVVSSDASGVRMTSKPAVGRTVLVGMNFRRRLEFMTVVETPDSCFRNILYLRDSLGVVQGFQLPITWLMVVPKRMMK